MPSVSHSPRLAFILFCSTALAGMVAVIPPASAQSAQAQSFSFNIPARPLASAIAQVGAVTGWRIAYSVALPAGATSVPLAGTMSAEEAVRRLLANTGLTYRITGPRSIVLEARAANAPAQAEDGSELLDTIAVTTGTAPRDVPFETPGSSSYISQEQIERLPPQSAGDIFIGTPGVISSMNRNGAAMDVNIRGLQGQNRVKVTIDGTLQSTSTWRGYQGVDDRVYVDPDLIGGVDIEKGPNTGAEGAGVIGGVVGIRTLNAGDIVEEGKEYGVRVRLSVADNGIDPPPRFTKQRRTDGPGLEDFENWSGSIAAGVRQENYDIVAAFAKRQSGNYFAGTNGPTQYTLINSSGTPITRNLSPFLPGTEVFNTSEDIGSGLVKATLRFAEDQSIELGYMRYENEYGEVSPSVIKQGYDTIRQIGLSTTVVDTYTARYRWSPTDNDLVDFRANIWATHIDEVTWYAFPGPVFPEWGIYPLESQRPNTTTTYGGDISNTSRFDTALGALKLDYGASYSLEDAQGSAYKGDGGLIQYSLTGTRAVGGIYSNAELVATEWLKFNGGLRYDFYSTEDGSDPEHIPPTWGDIEFKDKSGGRLSPTASITLTPLAGVQLYALYTEGMRPPSLRESSYSESFLFPNPDLEPEIARNWEFGLNVLKGDLLFGGDKLRLKVAYFDNNYEDYISRVMYERPTIAYYTTRNIDKAKFSGIEVSGGYDAGFLFTEFSLNYYTDVQFCDEGVCSNSALPMDYGQNHVPPEFTATLTLGMRAFDNRLVMGARMNHVGSRALPLSGNYDSFTATWLPYTVVDLFGSYKLNPNLTLNGSVQNVGDRYYVDALANTAMPSPGRTIRVGVTGTF